jgi:LmbE family N-acetylglucosaminyl deacetylase
LVIKSIRSSLVALALASISAAGFARTPEQYAPAPVAGAQDRVLIIAPHIDDEAIAACGYAAAALAAGARVYVVYLTAGDGNRISAGMVGRSFGATPKAYYREGLVRIREARAAMAMLGVPEENIFILGYPDGGLRRMMNDPAAIVPSRARKSAVPYSQALSPGAAYRLSNLLQDLKTVIEATDPTIVIAPVEFDSHPDHSAAGTLTKLALAGRPNVRLLGYLIHARRFPAPFLMAPNHRLVPPAAARSRYEWVVFPLTPEAEKLKQRVLGVYRSQRRDPYLSFLIHAFIRRNELFVLEE